MIEIKPATATDIPIIRQLAEDIWWPAYSPILVPDQIRYMLDTIYSAEAMQEELESGRQHFLVLYDEGIPKAFASYGPRHKEPDVYKLHKLYVLPISHGRGYGRRLIEYIIGLLKPQGFHTLDLNVNRHNKAKGFYEKLGFQVIHEEDIPIGPYWMNDYVMRITF